jgi:hypothetical protein
MLDGDAQGCALGFDLKPFRSKHYERASWLVCFSRFFLAALSLFAASVTRGQP